MTDWHWQMLLAVAVDAVFGDPENRPHPVRWVGALASRFERIARRLFGANRRVAGTAATLAVYAVVLFVSWLVLTCAGYAPPPFGFLAGTVMIYYSLAARDLLDHAYPVYRELAAGDVGGAREAVSRIVGRDTAGLDASGVAGAATESVAESFADGVAGPLFWAALLGPLGAVLHRAVNTLDSMFGHMDDRYREFGSFAARVDDVMGYVPARLAAACLCAAGSLAGKGERAWRIWCRDHAKHASPNAGHPESAMAGLLGVRLGGMAFYDGEAHDRPVLGRPGRDPAPLDILAALGYSGIAYVLLLVLLLALSLAVEFR